MKRHVSRERPPRATALSTGLVHSAQALQGVHNAINSLMIFFILYGSGICYQTCLPWSTGSHAVLSVQNAAVSHISVFLTSYGLLIIVSLCVFDHSLCCWASSSSYCSAFASPLLLQGRSRNWNKKRRDNEELWLRTNHSVSRWTDFLCCRVLHYFWLAPSITVTP